MSIKGGSDAWRPVLAVPFEKMSWFTSHCSSVTSCRFIAVGFLGRRPTTERLVRAPDRFQPGPCAFGLNRLHPPQRQSCRPRLATSQPFTLANYTATRMVSYRPRILTAASRGVDSCRPVRQRHCQASTSRWCGHPLASSPTSTSRSHKKGTAGSAAADAGLDPTPRRL